MKDEKPHVSLVHWLTHPSVPVSDPSRLRQIKLLSAVLLFFIGASMAYAAVQYWLEPEFQFGVFWITGCCLMLLGAYTINRRGFFHLATAISLAIISLSILGIMVIRPDPLSARYFAVLALPMVLGGILLNIRQMVVLFLLNLCAALAVAIFTPHLPGKETASSLAAFITISVFLLVFIRHRDMVEKDRQRELRKREEQLQQARKMESIGRLAGGVAHDFNNLLTVILGHSDLLLHNVEENPANKGILGSLEGVRTAAQRAAELTRQLLTFSRKQPMKPKLMDLNELVSSMKKMLVRLIGEHIKLDTRFIEGEQLVIADPSQMQQVVMNLAVNAADAMPQGGALTLETDRVFLDESYCRHRAEVNPGYYVMLAVSDTGSGIDEETAKYIFEPFYTTKAENEGTGLGLSTVYGAVKQNKGHIWFYSEIGKGTIFKVYFPVAGSDEAAREERNEAGERMRFSVKSGVEKILVVEDEEGLREIMQQVLEGCGYDVFTAANGNLALQWLENHRENRETLEDEPLHLLITDIVMPGINGQQLAKKVAKKIPGIKILYISGYTETRLQSLGLDMDHTSFLSKPFSPLVLCQRVREMLDGER